MSDTYNVRAASARLAGLSAYGHQPDPETEAHYRRVLATARIDRELRKTGQLGVQINDVQAAHLVGLLLTSAGVGPDTLSHIERDVRAAVVAAQEADDA